MPVDAPAFSRPVMHATGPISQNHYISSPLPPSSFERTQSVDDMGMKVRKPYTITKQRERWAEEEHHKFLEALRLHGRAWRRIEEHIGTKTAVQIRSHAQKFFSKIERDASAGRLPAQKVLADLDVPPPRPKRKPSHSYPRKAGGVFSWRPEGDGRTIIMAENSEGSPHSQTTSTSGTGLTSVKLFGQTLVAPTPVRPAAGPCGRVWTPSPHDTMDAIHRGQSSFSGSGTSDPIIDPTRSRRVSTTGRFATSGAHSDASMFDSGLSTQEWEETASRFHGYSRDQYTEALAAEAAATSSSHPYHSLPGTGGFSRWIGPSMGDLHNAACMAARLDPPGEGEEAAAMAAASAWWALRRAAPSAMAGTKVARAVEQEGGPGAQGRAARAARLKELKTRQSLAKTSETAIAVAVQGSNNRMGEGGDTPPCRRPRGHSMSGSNSPQPTLPPMAPATTPPTSSGSVEVGGEGEGEGGRSSNSSGIGSPQGAGGVEEKAFSDGGSSEADAEMGVNPPPSNEGSQPCEEQQKGHQKTAMDQVESMEGSRHPKLAVSEGGDARKEVSSGGRLAFQALFSRETLPRSFSPPRSGEEEEHKERKVPGNEEEAEAHRMVAQRWRGRA